MGNKTTLKPELKRNLQQTESGGYDVIGLPWMALEIKHQETLNLNAWWEQTERQCKSGQIPILAYRQNRKPWRVRMKGTPLPSINGMNCIVDIDLMSFLNWFHKIFNTKLII